MTVVFVGVEPRTRWTCEYRREHDRVRDVPVGEPCGATATHVIYWLDGSQRWSPACSDHLDLEPEAPEHRIARII